MQHKILVVDDCRQIQEFVADILEHRGYEVTTADDGLGAVLQFEEDKPDLLITDLTMPVMDGHELCRTIRRLSSVPIVLMTARRGAEEPREALSAGADAFVLKPFGVRGFLAQVAALLKGANPTAQKEDEGTDSGEAKTTQPDPQGDHPSDATPLISRVSSRPTIAGRQQFGFPSTPGLGLKLGAQRG